ncbi:MAG: hypothetical protein BWY81_01618 [Firmicutes bacterium ADurb.Bin467]|nr:MAG: hypothetical protein BWY81_01618 [Firmicutes bacterium ADurb.Bin467]
MFSETERFWQRLISWNTVEMPSSIASWGEDGLISLPLYTMVPASLWLTPVRHLMRVDFPAPFSPSSAWTSPLASEKSTLLSAFTPGNAISIPFIERIISRTA